MDNKTDSIKVRCTPEERAKYTWAEGVLGIKRSDYVRAALARMVKRAEKRNGEKDE